MSFQDVGRPGARAPPRQRQNNPQTTPSPGGYSSSPAKGGVSGGAFSLAHSGGCGGAVGGAVLDNDGASSSAAWGYEQVSDGIVQYQVRF